MRNACASGRVRGKKEERQLEQTWMEDSLPEESFTAQQQAEETAIIPASDAQAAAAVTVPVKFNKQERALSLDEAAAYAQKGMKWDAFTPCHEKLKALAAADGQSVAQLVDALVAGSDALLYERTLQLCGGNEEAAQHMVALERSQRAQKAAAFQAAEAEAPQREQAALEQRLAAEYAELAAFCPQAGDFGTLPEEVVRQAAEGMSLTEAYLRYLFEEQRRVAAVSAKQAAAAASSAGSQESHAPVQDESAAVEAMRRAIWG